MPVKTPDLVIRVRTTGYIIPMLIFLVQNLFCKELIVY